MKIPRWLKLQEEIDYWHFVLGQMVARQRNRKPIEIMINEATGFDKSQLKTAKRIIGKIEKLKAEFYKLTS